MIFSLIMIGTNLPFLVFVSNGEHDGLWNLLKIPGIMSFFALLKTIPNPKYKILGNVCSVIILLGNIIVPMSLYFDVDSHKIIEPQKLNSVKSKFCYLNEPEFFPKRKTYTIKPIKKEKGYRGCVQWLIPANQTVNGRPDSFLLCFEWNTKLIDQHWKNVEMAAQHLADSTNVVLQNYHYDELKNGKFELLGVEEKTAEEACLPVLKYIGPIKEESSFPWYRWTYIIYALALIVFVCCLKWQDDGTENMDLDDKPVLDKRKNAKEESEKINKMIRKQNFTASYNQDRNRPWMKDNQKSKSHLASGSRIGGFFRK